MTLKLYVYDHGWSGADIYVAESKEVVLQKLRDVYLPHYRKGAANHRESQGGNSWLRNIEYWESLKPLDTIQEYEIVDGLEVFTDGDS